MSCRPVCRARPSRGRPAFLFSWQSARAIPRQALRVRSPALFVLIAVEVALNRRRSQKLLDPLCFLESLVSLESNFRSKFQVDAPPDLTAHITLVAIECFDHLIDVAAAERHHINRREPQVGA